MDEYFQKIKSWVFIPNKKDVSYKKRGINPTRDWNIILIVVFVVLIIMSIISSYLYNQIKDGNLFTSNTGVKNINVKINESLLTDTIKDIDSRSVIFNDAKITKTTVADPSI